MATPTVAEKLSAQTEASATVTLGAGTQDTDYLVCFHFIDFYAASSMLAPTGTSTGTWQLLATGDAGTNDVHVKVWGKLAIAGSQTVIVNAVTDACCWNTTYVLRGTYAAAPVDDAAGSQSSTNSASHIAPSVTPPSPDALLLCGVIAGGPGSYTPPSGMTEDFDTQCSTYAVSSVAELALSSSGATGTKTFTFTGSVHNATATVAIAGSAPATTSIPWATSRQPLTRDPGEVQWLQRERRDISIVASAANPPVSPLDSAWQAGGPLWHLYARPTDITARVWQPQQRPYLSVPGQLATAELENELLGGAETGKRYAIAATHYDRRESPQQRAYVSTPGLLSPALLENELLGNADDLRRHAWTADFYDRREMPQQRWYVSDPGLLGTAQLEDALLGGATTGGRYLLAAGNADRREVPQQRAYMSVPDLLATAELENELLGGAETGKRASVAATHAPRWWMPQQPGRVATTPGLLDTALLEGVLLGGADDVRHRMVAAYGDRREMPQQRWYLSDPSLYPTVAPVDPLTIAYGAGGTYWLLYNIPALTADRRQVPQQRRYVADPGLLATSLLENELLGGGDLARHGMWFTDRRQMPQQQRPNIDTAVPVAFDTLLRAVAPARPPATGNSLAFWQRPVVAPPDVDANPLLYTGGQLRTNTPATHADRRQTAWQPPRLVLYFDAGPDVPPLTLAWGAGGNMWHLYNRAAIPPTRWWSARAAARSVPAGIFRDLILTVGEPQAKWAAGMPAAKWRAGDPYAKWAAGPPMTA